MFAATPVPANLILHPGLSRFLSLIAIAILLAPRALPAGGPRYIAGSTFFNPSVMGQPLHWAGGKVNYYVDQGPLNAAVSNQQATAMVDAAAALWSNVPTAAISLTDMGPLNEDVSSRNIQVSSTSQITAPADITPAATNYPIAVIYDADGSVINSIYGPTASRPNACQTNGVYAWIDNFYPDATFAHGVILLNGLCATSADLLAIMSFQIERAFGSILGLDFSQVNPGALTGGAPDAALGSPVMQPLSGACAPTGGACIPDPAILRYDDIAALNRLYPVTAANLADFPSKQLTAPNTVSIQGTVSFASGYGMQGVNVVARPLDSSGNPLTQYAVTAVTGALFSGNHGNPIAGFTDPAGNPLSMWGSNDPALQGSFDLSGIPLPPGVASAGYQITFEAINPPYILSNSVGPYTQGQVAPSGTLQPVTLSKLSAGDQQTVSVTASGSAASGFNDAIASASQPLPIPIGGRWIGRLSQVGQTDWFTLPVRGNRALTIVAQALDESGSPTASKAMPSIGIWDASAPVSSSPARAVRSFNTNSPGETALAVTTNGDEQVRIAIADLRGDGRPDFVYTGCVLYADSVSPTHLPHSGGPITIQGLGFRIADTVLIGGQPAQILSISPTQISAIAPPATNGVSGPVDIEIDDHPGIHSSTLIPSGITYDSGTGDALTLNSAPSGTVPIGVPIPFAVTAHTPSLASAAGVTVIYTVTSGTATLACGLPACSVIAGGDGRAALNITAIDGTWSTITASLTNGSSLQTEFAGGIPPALAALTPQLSLAAGATITWPVQAIALSNGLPAANQSVAWQTLSGSISPQGSPAALTTSSGIATKNLTVGPLAEGQVTTANACLNGTSQCVPFTAYGARPGYASLLPISGTSQTLAASASPSQVALRLLDMDGNPMAGGTVALYQSLYAWSPPCAPHAVCSPAVLLSSTVSTAISAIDGSVLFTPISIPGIATTLDAVAVTGNSAALPITIRQHP